MSGENKNYEWPNLEKLQAKEVAMFDVKEIKAGSAQIRNFSSALVLQDRELPSGAVIPEK